MVGLEDVPGAIDRDRVFDFLVDATEWVDTTSTFFAEVHRLPPAHTLTVTSDDRRLRRYWNLPEPEMLRLRSDEEYQEATREVLDLAVRCRLRGRADVGVVLSGGIDSSSIAATARKQGPVRSFSAVSDRDDTTETAFIHATTAKLSLDAQYVDPSQVRDSRGDFTSAQRSYESLFDNVAMVHTVFDAARRDGCRSVVTGVLADEVVAIPASLAMSVFLAERHPAKVVQLAASRGNLATWTGRLGLARSAISVMLRRSERMERLQSSRRARQRDDWLRRSLGDGVLRPTDDERTRLIARLDATGYGSAPGDTPWWTRHRLFDGGYSAAALERYERTAAACSLEIAAPSWIAGSSSSSSGFLRISSSRAVGRSRCCGGAWPTSCRRQWCGTGGSRTSVGGSPRCGSTEIRRRTCAVCRQTIRSASSSTWASCSQRLTPTPMTARGGGSAA